MFFRFRAMPSRHGNILIREYLCKIETKFENILGYLSETKDKGLADEKSQRLKFE
jgi:hypothetical protein